MHGKQTHSIDRSGEYLHIFSFSSFRLASAMPEIVSDISSRPVSVHAGYNLAPRFVMLFVGLPSLQGDALFGGPFSLRQVASSSTSPTSDKAAPNVDEPPPFALSGASPSLPAQHEEQHFLFLLKSFAWLHRWHGHDEARRVADHSVDILLREDEREGD